jgi:hypothetical protein
LRPGPLDAGRDALHPARTASGRRSVKKDQLPRKDCMRCGRPFTWRKKWERDWDNVKYCSDRCRMGKPQDGVRRG